jgi:hypothetical protein
MGGGWLVTCSALFIAAAQALRALHRRFAICSAYLGEAE